MNWALGFAGLLVVLIVIVASFPNPPKSKPGPGKKLHKTKFGDMYW